MQPKATGGFGYEEPITVATAHAAKQRPHRIFSKLHAGGGLIAYCNWCATKCRRCKCLLILDLSVPGTAKATVAMGCKHSLCGAKDGDELFDPGQVRQLANGTIGKISCKMCKAGQAASKRNKGGKGGSKGGKGGKGGKSGERGKSGEGGSKSGEGGGEGGEGGGEVGKGGEGGEGGSAARSVDSSGSSGSGSSGSGSLAAASSASSSSTSTSRKRRRSSSNSSSRMGRGSSGSAHGARGFSLQRQLPHSTTVLGLYRRFASLVRRQHRHKTPPQSPRGREELAVVVADAVRAFRLPRRDVLKAHTQFKYELLVASRRNERRAKKKAKLEKQEKQGKLR